MPLGNKGSLQLLVAITPHWESLSGSLYLYERSSLLTPWVQQKDPISINVGRKGLAWGRGLHPPLSGNQKKEGDGKGPAGIFRIGVAFGHLSHQYHASHLPFVPITDDLEAVDDPHSAYYNQLVSAHQVKKDWTSSEKMAEIGSMYALGLLILHNTDPIEKGAGSCIFLHNHETLGAGSSGCTVMKPYDVIRVVRFLDREKQPCLVQLPQEEYLLRQKEWDLP